MKKFKITGAIRRLLPSLAYFRKKNSSKTDSIGTTSHYLLKPTMNWHRLAGDDLSFFYFGAHRLTEGKITKTITATAALACFFLKSC